MIIAILLSLLVAAMIIITLLVVIVHLLVLMRKDRKVHSKERCVLIVWLVQFCPNSAHKETSKACQVSKDEHCSAKKHRDVNHGCPAFSTSRAAVPRERKTKVIPCIKGTEENSRFEQHLETKPAAVTLYHYLPSWRQEWQTSVKVAITRGGTDTGFQGSGSMATGNGDSSEVDTSDNPQSGSEAEQLPEPTACKDGEMMSGADSVSPDDLLQNEGTMPSDKETCVEGETLAHPGISKQAFVSEAEKHFLASDQVSPADLAEDSKGEEEVSCNGKMESAEKAKTVLMNEEKMEADDEEMVASEGKTQAEDTETMGAVDKGKTEAEGKVSTSQTKRTSSIIPGHLNVAKAVGATAQKQQGTHAAATCQGQFECKLLSTGTPETDSKKDSVNAPSPPKVEQQPDDRAVDLPAAGSLPCSRRVAATNVGEPPPVPHLRWVEDAQDVFTIHNECAEVTIEGQPVQTLMVQMEPHDFHLPLLPPHRSDPHLPLPTQESEEGRRRPSQLALSWPVEQ